MPSRRAPYTSLAKPRVRIDPSRSGTLGVYDDRRWRRVRLLHLKDEPLCRHCKAEGLIIAADVVDHIKPLRAGGEKYDDSNLQSLCDKHHAIKTAQDKEIYGIM